jgi:hypothetical protein
LVWRQKATIENRHYLILETDLENNKLFVDRIDHGSDNIAMIKSKEL